MTAPCSSKPMSAKKNCIEAEARAKVWDDQYPVDRRREQRLTRHCGARPGRVTMKAADGRYTTAAPTSLQAGARAEMKIAEHGRHHGDGDNLGAGGMTPSSSQSRI